MKTFPLLAAAWLAVASGCALAQTTVKEAWVRGTVPQQQASGLFAEITSTKGGRLVAVSSPVAAVVEIHEMAMEGNVMRMRALPEGLALPAGKTVTLRPGGYHVMLMGLKQQLKAGEKIPFTLTVEEADKTRETINIEAPVRALGAMPGAMKTD